MRVIDAHTGFVVKPGVPVHLPWTGSGERPWYKLVSVDEGVLSAKAKLLFSSGDTREVPLTVRYLHPAFLFEKVAFVES